MTDAAVFEARSMVLSFGARPQVLRRGRSTVPPWPRRS